MASCEFVPDVQVSHIGHFDRDLFQDACFELVPTGHLVDFPIPLDFVLLDGFVKVPEYDFGFVSFLLAIQVQRVQVKEFFEFREFGRVAVLGEVDFIVKDVVAKCIF